MRTTLQILPQQTFTIELKSHVKNTANQLESVVSKKVVCYSASEIFNLFSELKSGAKYTLITIQLLKKSESISNRPSLTPSILHQYLLPVFGNELNDKQVLEPLTIKLITTFPYCKAEEYVSDLTFRVTHLLELAQTAQKEKRSDDLKIIMYEYVLATSVETFIEIFRKVLSVTNGREMASIPNKDLYKKYIVRCLDPSQKASPFTNIEFEHYDHEIISAQKSKSGKMSAVLRQAAGNSRTPTTPYSRPISGKDCAYQYRTTSSQVKGATTYANPLPYQALQHLNRQVHEGYQGVRHPSFIQPEKVMGYDQSSVPPFLPQLPTDKQVRGQPLHYTQMITRTNNRPIDAASKQIVERYGHKPFNYTGKSLPNFTASPQTTNPLTRYPQHLHKDGYGKGKPINYMQMLSKESQATMNFVQQCSPASNEGSEPFDHTHEYEPSLKASPLIGNTAAPTFQFKQPTNNDPSVLQETSKTTQKDKKESSEVEYTMQIAFSMGYKE